jgi:DNA-binding transcriptional LysR family regulator
VASSSSSLARNSALLPISGIGFTGFKWHGIGFSVNITLRQISYFLATAETGSVSGAAASLGISQSAITESIRALEGQTGAVFFDRHSKGVSLTYQGHQFLRHARLIMAAVADAGRALDARPEAISGVLNLGVTSLVAGYYLADLLARFRRVFPNVRVQVVEEERPYVEHLLVNGELHLALMLVSNLDDHAALDAVTLEQSRSPLWIAPSHPFAARDHVSFEEVAAEPLIVLTIDEVAGVTRQWWTRRGLRPNVVLNTSSVEAVRSLVATGAGVAVLPDMAFRPWSLEGDRLEARIFDDELPSIDVGLAWRRGSALSETSRMFLKLAQERNTRLRTIGFSDIKPPV